MERDMAEAAMHATGEAIPNRAFKNPQNRSYRHGPRDEEQLPSVDDLEVAAAAAEAAMEAIRALEAVGGPLPFLSDDQANGLPPLVPPSIPPIPISSIKVNFNVDTITGLVSLKLDLPTEKAINDGSGRTTAATRMEEDDAFCEDVSLPSSSSSSSSSDDDDDDSESDLDIITDYADIKKMIDAMDKNDVDMADDDDGGNGGDSPNTRKALNATNKTQAATELFGELPLPDVSQIVISPEDTLLPAGCIQAIVEGMVVVKGVDTLVPPLNEGCVLVLETTRTAIGVIEDIFGPVTAPLYALRYNTTDANGNDGLVVGAAVASVDRLAHYIDSFEELQVKGYDASEDDGMDPEVEFSDDEAEAEYKRQLKVKKRKDNGSSGCGGGGGGGGGRGRGRGRGEGGGMRRGGGRGGGGNRGPAQPAAFPSQPPSPPPKKQQQQQPPSSQPAPPQAGSAYHYQPWPPRPFA